MRMAAAVIVPARSIIIIVVVVVIISCLTMKVIGAVIVAIHAVMTNTVKGILAGCCYDWSSVAFTKAPCSGDGDDGNGQN